MNSSKWLSVLFGAVIASVVPAGAHDWHRHDDPQFASLPYISPFAAGPKAGAVKLLASTKSDGTTFTDSNWTPAASPTTSFAPATLGAATLFAQTFVKFNPAVRFWWDSSNFYVEGDGTPAHSMMVGISSWQRQIPVPPYYFGTNIWALPLYPVPAATNILVTTNRFTQGAIALAANGIPIFNPYNNTGRISAQIGELDLWGGHCGRGDDYHYHAAPLHLTSTLGVSLPLAFAMDGYPVFGLVEPDGSALNTNTLDNVYGHTNFTGSYHYHSSSNFPYVNGGFHGVITEITNGAATQAGVQPRAGGVRPAGTPLAGAYIQGFTNLAPDQFQMFFSVPSNSPPTNYWLYTLNRASNTVSVTYASYDTAYSVTTTNYANWRPAPAFTSTNEPLVTTQPANLALAAGSTATFSITAAGFGSLAYQWFKDGVELANGSGIGGVNTATLSLTNVQAGDVGAYTVVVTNTVGNTMSGAATLAVTGAINTPPTLAALSSRVVIPGQTLLITNVANDAETPGLLTFSLSSSLPGPTINATNGLVTWITTTNNANSTNQLTVVLADNGSPNLFATQSCIVTVVGTRSISQGLATTVTSNLFPAGQRVSGVGTITAFDGTVWTVPAATPFATSPKVPDLWNQNAGVTPTNIAAAATAIANLTTNVIDADGEVITGYIFCDNYFELFVNGVLVGVDPVPYTPFNSCVVKFKAKRPITYAVRLVDWEENLGVGTELNAGDPNHSGDGGFIASFSDGTVTGPNWKAQSFYIAPLDNPNLVVEMPDGSHNSSSASNSTTLGTNAYALHYLVPTNWFSKSFNHSNWPSATTFTEAQVGVNNLYAYLNFPAQFGSSGAQFIWSKNLVLDNEVIVRFTGPAPATNTAPVFTAAPTNRYVINGGDTLIVTNTATDADLPAQTLTYSLLAPPAGATINTNTGVVTWITTTNNSGTSNLLQVVVTDSGSPNLSATNSFTVFVRSLKPNVVLIVTDDQGWHDISAHGAEAPTPNMDRLGSEGVRLERFYATPVCSVTRSTMLTGRSTLRTQVGNARGLDLHEHIMPQTFKAAGYQTYMVGKWHLGGFYNNDTNVVINGVTNLVVQEGVEYQPQRHGWDYHYGQYGGAIGYLSHNSAEPGFNTRLDWWENGQTNLDAGWSGDLEAAKAVSLIQNRDPSKPVILYLALNAVHPGVSAPTNYLNKYLSITNTLRRTMVAALDQMDVNIGQVLNTLDSENITTNTLVVYFSDNAADTNSGGLNIPLRGTKNDYFEAGIHTPAAVRWPGVIPAGVTNCNQFISVVDIFPTICAATGVTPQNTKPLDGTNVWPLLLGATNGEFNPTNYRGGPLFSSSASAALGAAVYDVFSNGTNLTMFKLIHYRVTGNIFTNLLFDIVNDPLETTDQIANPAYTNIVLALTASYNAAAVTEKYGPYIGVQPQSQSVAAGSNVTLFAMTTVYTTPLGVQWRKNGTNISGATNYALATQGVYLTTLNLTNVTLADAATYDVVVTNAAVGWPASSNSLPAVLTVIMPSTNTAPVITTITNRTVSPNTTLLVSVSNNVIDPDVPPQVLAFSLLGPTFGASIDINTGLFTWTPTTGQADTTNLFTVVVTDNGTPALSATNTFSVVVLPNGSQFLTISGVTRTPATPASNNLVTVTGTVSSSAAISQVQLTYSAGTQSTNVVFREIFANGSTASGLAGALNTWTNAAVRAAADVKQRGSTANHTTPVVLTGCGTTNGSTAVSCAANTNIFAGMSISGTNIAGGATISSVTSTTSFVISVAATGTGTGQSLTAAGVTLAGCTITTGTNIVTCATTNGLSVGMGISGGGLVTQPPNPTIASITDATHFTLNNNATTGGTNITLTAAGCGLEFANGTVNYTDTMAGIAGVINAGSATAGGVDFWVRTADLFSNNGWTFQISPDGGTTWNTRLSENFLGSSATNCTLNATTNVTCSPASDVSKLTVGNSIQGIPVSIPLCTITNGSTVVATTNTASLMVGMFVSGPNAASIPANARITAITPGVNFTLSAAPTPATSPTTQTLTANYLPGNATVTSINVGAGSFGLNAAAFASGTNITLSSVNHGFQLKHYDLVAGDMTANMKIRFQMSGYAGAVAPARPPAVDFDDIAVTLATVPALTNVTMFDDGAHGDGGAGDGVYGGAIPAFPTGTTVNYFVTASNAAGLLATNPVGAPGTTYSYTVTVPVNNAPSLAAQIDRTVNPTYTLLVTNVATDLDLPAQTLTFSLLSPPANASINSSNGVFTFAPSLGQLGSTNTVTVVVTDNGSPAMSATNSFKAIVLANTAPILSAIANRTNNAGDTVLITNVTTDAEAPPQILTYSLTTAPAGASINASSGVITWATTGANAGTTTNFTVVVSDNGVPSLIAAQSFSVTIRAITNAPWSMLKLPDTGQVADYTTTFGEDSDYSINPQSFTDNGNGTTTDNVTGLMWQKADGGEMTIASALLYAQTNLNPANFAGYNDWRLPTVHELLSIMNHDRLNPAFNTNFFTSPGATNFGIVYWWSRDPQKNSTNQWCVNAGGGVGPKHTNETISAGGTFEYRVRCVRGAPAPATNSPIHHLVNNGNGTITDTDTSLTWQQLEIGAATDWTNALIYCENLVLGGFQDWRLPNIKELESLNDETLANPSIDTNFFPNAKSARYWSSTTQFGHATNAWWNEFIAGITSYEGTKSTNYWVRAVRGGLSNTPPSLAAISNRAVNAGVTIQITNTASDAQTAPGFLIFNLLTTSSNASVNPSSGLFTWRPAVAQAGTTNTFTVVVADTGSPILNTTQQFSVFVNPLVGPSVTQSIMSNGSLRLLITGDVGPDYTVQATTNFTNWTNVAVTNSPTPPFNWTDPDAGSFLYRFYRVILGP